MDGGLRSQCAVVNHERCGGCGEVVTRNSDHCHVYRDRGFRTDVVCGECWGTFAIAALHVLRVAQSLGIDPSPAGIDAALNTQKIVILGQLGLM